MYKYKFNVVVTYSDREQEIYDIEMNDIENEESFLFRLFRSENNLKSIIKYSVCQLCKNIEEYLPFLERRNGKYYFNEEDVEALNIKNKFLRDMNYHLV